MESVHPLRKWREESGQTLAQLGEKVGVTPSHLSEIERRVNTPSLDLAFRLSRATGGLVPIENFLSEQPEVSE